MESPLGKLVRLLRKIPTKAKKPKDGLSEAPSVPGASESGAGAKGETKEFRDIGNVKDVTPSASGDDKVKNEVVKRRRARESAKSGRVMRRLDKKLNAT